MESLRSDVSEGMNIERLIEKLLAFSCSRLALVQAGEMTLQEAVWLIDANADGMFEVLEFQGLWSEIQRLEEKRANLREGIRVVFGELPSDTVTQSPDIVEAAAMVKLRIQNIVSLQHRQNQKAIHDLLGG